MILKNNSKYSSARFIQLTHFIIKVSASFALFLLLVITFTVVWAEDIDWDEPFTEPQYLIHLTGTYTYDGFAEKDSYFLYKNPPEEGVLITPDGSGGTFKNTVDFFSGPYSTPRQVCNGAKGLPTQTYNAWNSNEIFDCKTIKSSIATGVSDWWQDQGFRSELLIIGGLILVFGGALVSVGLIVLIFIILRRR